MIVRRAKSLDRRSPCSAYLWRLGETFALNGVMLGCHKDFIELIVGGDFDGASVE